MNPEENSHEPLVERALVGFDLAAEHHISNCEPCQSEREQVADALRGFGAASREYTQRPQSFWEQQAAKIRAARGERSGRRVALALAPGLAVLLLLALAMVARRPTSSPVTTAAVTPVVTEPSDHELLLEVERAVGSDTPLALGPATLMVEENEDSLPVSSTNTTKVRGTHEN